MKYNQFWATSSSSEVPAADLLCWLTVPIALPAH